LAGLSVIGWLVVAAATRGRPPIAHYQQALRNGPSVPISRQTAYHGRRIRETPAPERLDATIDQGMECMNTFRTAFLLAVLTALFAFAGLIIGGASGMLIAFLMAMVMNVVSYWNSDKMVLRMQGAQEVDAQSSPDYVNMIKQLSANAGLPLPRVYIMHNPQPNAFATGRNPQNAAVCATTGLFELLSPKEVAGVMAHELAHVKNRDTLTMTISATLAGAIGMLANFAQFGAIFGGSRNNNGRGGFIGLLLVSMLAPMAAGIVQMAVSRSREYEADKLGAQISGDPLGLASALSRIQDYTRRIPNEVVQANPALAHLYIINPLFGGRHDNWFSTHPATENRIAALHELAHDMAQSPPHGGSFSDASNNPILGGPGIGGAPGPWQRS
jgi:heat shock protein HtpX